MHSIHAKLLSSQKFLAPAGLEDGLHLSMCDMARLSALHITSPQGDKTMTAENRNWQDLCEAASKEPDSERLMSLVSELIEALDERRTPANNASDRDESAL
jgi:hypothetical protein